jgi:hypothetical protein
MIPRTICCPCRLRRVLPTSASVLILLTVLVTTGLARGQVPEGKRTVGEVGQRFTEIDRSTTWRRVGAISLQFDAHHPQGMTRVGDDVFLSSVEVTEPRRPLDDGTGRRTPGAGKAHLFRVDQEGHRVAATELSEGARYHPGGLDYDGRHLWVPVAEYRPDSRSVIYRVDPQTLEAIPVLRVDDHIGAVVYDPVRQHLHGFNWGARRFYTWDLDDTRGSDDPRDLAPSRTARNGSFYIDYQDCQFVGGHHALCGGLRDYPGPEGSDTQTLGGLELVNLRATTPVWQLPLSLYAAPGVPMTRNPVYAEPGGDAALRFYFAPEDGRSTIYVYEVAPE